MDNLGFGRIMTAMVTPFTKDGEVDYKRSEQLAERLLASGTDTLVVCGTTGESPTLSAEEKLQLFKRIKKVAKDKPVVAGTGTNSTKASVEFSKAAEDCGVDGILVVAPYYNKPPQDCLLHHFETVAKAVKLPVIVYNIPGRTGIEIKPEIIAKLAEIPNITAVKEALPSLEPISSLETKLAAMPPLCQGYEKWVAPQRSMEIYSGDDSATLPILSIGGAGVISVASHVAGPLMQKMIEAFFAGRVAEAKAIHCKLYPLFTGLFATTNPILPKAALKLQGFPVGGLRMPLRKATPQEEETLAKIMSDAGVL